MIMEDEACARPSQQIDVNFASVAQASGGFAQQSQHIWRSLLVGRDMNQVVCALQSTSSNDLCTLRFSHSLGAFLCSSPTIFE